MSALWTPYSIERKLSFWFDAQDPNDNQGNGVPDNGLPIPEWKDKSLNKHILAQPTVADRPTYDTANKAINFDGNQHLKIAGLDNFPEIFHIFIVANITRTANSEDNFVLAFDSSTAGKDYKYISEHASNATIENKFHYVDASAGDQTITSGAVVNSGVTALFEVFMEGGSKGSTAKVQLNDGTAVANSSAPFADNVSGDLYIMKNLESAQQETQGKIFEILIFNSVLTGIEQDAIQGYLEYKHSLDVLPVAHTHKKKPPITGQVGERFDGAHKISPRQPVQVVKMYLDFCDNLFSNSDGENTCTASGEQCFNTRFSCTDPDNYRTTSNGKREYVFISEQGSLASGVIPYAHPSLISVTNAPTEIIPTKGMSVRTNLTLKLRDFYSTDTDIDPYVNVRSFNNDTKPLPLDGGSYFQRLLARNPHYVGRTLEVYDGYFSIVDYDSAGGALNNGQEKSLFIQEGKRSYIIDSISLNKDVCSIKCKDPLTLGGELKSKVPKPSEFSMKAAINNSGAKNDQVLLIGGADATAAQIQAVFGTAGYVRINEEILAYTRGSGDANIDLAVRAQWGTTVDAHEADDVIQFCISFGDAPEVSSNIDLGSTINDVGFEILVNQAGIPASLCNNATGGIYSWADENTDWLSAFKIRTIISEPKEANKILNDLGSQVGVNFFYDDLSKQIVMKSETPTLNPELNVNVTDDHIIEDSFKLINSEKERISRVYYYYNQRNFTDKIKEPKSYKNLYVNIDAESEGDNEYGVEANKVVYGYGVQAAAIATTISQRLLNRFKLSPKTCEFKLDASFDTISTGDHFFLRTQGITDLYGFPRFLEMQCISVKFDPKNQYYIIKAKQFRFASSAGGQITVNALSVTTAGTGYTVGDALTFPNSSGGGTGMTCTVHTVNSGVVTAVTPTSFGLGYAIDETVTDSSGTGGDDCVITIKRETFAGDVGTALGSGTEEDPYTGIAATESYISSDSTVTAAQGEGNDKTHRSFISARVISIGEDWANGNTTLTGTTEISGADIGNGTGLTLTVAGNSDGDATAVTVTSNPATATHKGDSGHSGYYDGDILELNKNSAGQNCVIVLSVNSKMSNGREPYRVV